MNILLKDKHQTFKRMLVLSIVVVSIFTTNQKIFSNDLKPYGLMTAMPSEGLVYLNKMKDKHTIYVNGYRFYTGKLHEIPIIYVYSGIGKVNAAIATTLMIHAFHPKFIVFSGIAGSLMPTFNNKSVFLAASAVPTEHLRGSGPPSHDMMNNVNDQPTPNKFYASRLLLKIAKDIKLKNIPIYFGNLATTDEFPERNSLLQRIKGQAQAIDMEGAAFYQTCWLLKTKCLIARGFSNSSVSGKINKNYQIKKSDKNMSIEAVSRFVLTFLKTATK